MPVEPLIARLRQLSLIEIDAVLAGAPPEERGELARALVDDLEDALGQARERAAELVAQVGRGPAPLAFAAAGSAARLGAAPEQPASWTGQLAARAAAARQLARLWAAAEAVVPRLLAADRAATG